MALSQWGPSRIAALFSRKKKVKSAACMVSLDHVHTDACFIDVAALSVVELFQSQGCASCPPAVPHVHGAAAHNPNLLLLTYDVTYFDNHGWKDTFSSPQWDARQRAYATRWARKGLFTPQVIVDGLPNEVVGADEQSIGPILAAAAEAKSQSTLDIALEPVADDEVSITSDAAELEPHDVWVVEYDPKPQQVKIGGGANKKVKLQHLNVVKGLVKAGEWAGGRILIRLPPQVSQDHKRAVFVQQGPGGPILAALKLA